MPQYKVIKPGFFEGKLYDPEGKRKVLNTDKPFTKKKNPMPSWLSEMPEESPELKKKREAYEKAQAELDEAKAEEDKADIAAASSEGAGIDENGDLKGESFLDVVKNKVGLGDKSADNSDTVETI